MGNFNRDNRSGGGKPFERRGFDNRGSRGPVQMHQAVCDNCGKSCEVPFRPTNGRSIYCSDCFENRSYSQPQSQSQSQPQNRVNPVPDNKPQFEQINNKLDKILELLTLEVSVSEEEEVKPAKKKPSKSPASL